MKLFAFLKRTGKHSPKAALKNSPPAMRNPAGAFDGKNRADEGAGQMTAASVAAEASPDLEDKYRALAFAFFSSRINLPKYERFLMDHHIEYIEKTSIMCHEEIVCSRISKYFYLLNRVHLDSLTPQEAEYLQNADADSDERENSEFIRNTYLKVLKSRSPNSSVFYGPFMNPRFQADHDAIAIGLKYNVYGLAAGYKKELEQIDKEDALVKQMIHEIESAAKPYKIKIIRYDELYEFLNRNDPLSNGRRHRSITPPASSQGEKPCLR